MSDRLHEQWTASLLLMLQRSFSHSLFSPFSWGRMHSVSFKAPFLSKLQILEGKIHSLPSHHCWRSRRRGEMILNLPARPRTTVMISSRGVFFVKGTFLVEYLFKAPLIYLYWLYSKLLFSFDKPMWLCARVHLLGACTLSVSLSADAPLCLLLLRVNWPLTDEVQTRLLNNDTEDEVRWWVGVGVCMCVSVHACESEWVWWKRLNVYRSEEYVIEETWEGIKGGKYSAEA